MRYLLLLGLLCFTILAQAQERLVLGTAQSIAISAASPSLLEYRGRAGESIQISAIAQESGETSPDLVLWLVYAGQLLAYNDNQAESRNPLLRLTLPADGLYQIYLDSFNGVSVGTAELLVASIDPFNLSSAENRLQIDLPAAQVFRHEFLSDGNINITVKDLRGGLDPYLRLLDESGAVIAENDDHASPDLSLGLLDSRLSLNLAPATYTLEVHDFLGRAGRLEISLD